MSKKKYVRDYIPNLDKLYDKVREFIKTHQGEKGYIDCQPNLNLDTIYAILYDGEEGYGVENYVYAVRVVNGEVEVLLEPVMRSYLMSYNNPEDFTGKEAEDKWYSLRDGDVYYVHTLISIAESIEEYVEEEEPTYLGGKKWDELSEHDKGVVADLEM